MQLQRYKRQFFRRFFIFLIICIATKVSAQNFSSIGKIVNNYPEHITSIDKLSKHIREDFSTPEKQIMALYFWMATTIEYNLNEYKYGHDSYSFRYSSKEELEKKIAERDAQIVKTTLKTRKAVCEGYAKTFEQACIALNIECVVISGYSKTEGSAIGKLPLTEKHAWNAVKIAGTWKFVDATWGAGYAENSDYWLPKFDPYYLFTPPSEFIGSHFPEDEKWQLLAQPLSEKEFVSQPVYSSLYYALGIELITPKTGIIVSKTEAHYIFEFSGMNQAVELGYAYEKDYYLTSIIPEFENGIAKIQVPAKGKKNTFVNILIGTEMIVKFYIK